MNKVSQSNAIIYAASAAVVIIFGLFALILWKMEFFTFTGEDASAKIVASSIALLGALFGSLVTLLGLIFKHSIDQRSIALREQTEARERMESEHNNRLAEGAERRLRVEAAIQSIGLLSSPSGQDVPNTQRAGVILALGDLEMFSIALSLVDQMIPRGRIDMGTVCWLLDKALRSGDREVQVQASIMAEDYVSKMLLPRGTAQFPAALLDENVIRLPDSARRTAVWAIIDLITLRTFDEWSSNTLVTLVDVLHYIWSHESQADIKTDAGVALLTFLENYPQDNIFYFMTGTRVIRDVVKDLAEFTGLYIQGNSPDGIPRLTSLLNWSKGKPVLIDEVTGATEVSQATPKPEAVT